MSPTIDWPSFDAVLFDLDGVLTSTARVHAAAWKRTFDDFLAAVAPDQTPFDIAADYRAHVDGRPRYDGVATFLASRGIELPRGDPSDPPGWGTICAVGNKKNDLVTELLATEGAEVYPGSQALLDALIPLDLALAVVSASANAADVLAAAGIGDRFEVLVDGRVAAELGLAGKPQPDPFLEAARRLGVQPARAVVVEDAVAGVEAGVAGGFGAVIGVDRHHDPDALATAGATIVVSDLGELTP
ncbi:MAG TPA: beta-phosphoglucomutase family hydrolase [Acidimicrobiia bacterium]|nr:beta-phosphoglucomutase family hydrolase [Acidimicrobiia bacterium]